MTEQMKLRGTLEGHGGWVTQIATTSEVPDMILSSSRGTCIIRSLCVTVSFGRTLFPFLKREKKHFLLCCSFSVIFASLVCSWLKSIYLVQGARHPTVCAPIRIVRTYAPCTIPPSPPPLPSFYTCGKPFFGLPAVLTTLLSLCAAVSLHLFLSSLLCSVWSYNHTQHVLCLPYCIQPCVHTRKLLSPSPPRRANSQKKRRKKNQYLYYVKRL